MIIQLWPTTRLDLKDRSVEFDSKRGLKTELWLEIEFLDFSRNCERASERTKQRPGRLERAWALIRLRSVCVVMVLIGLNRKRRKKEN